MADNYANHIASQNKSNSLASIEALAKDPTKGVTAEEAHTASKDLSDAKSPQEILDGVLGNHKVVDSQANAFDATIDGVNSDSIEDPISVDSTKVEANPEGNTNEDGDENPVPEETPEDKAKTIESNKAYNERYSSDPRTVEYQSKVKELEPMAEKAQIHDNFCHEWGITSEQQKEGMEILALTNREPKQAIERLTAFVEHLKLATGQSLPKDLADEVEANTMSLSRAKELATARLQLQAQKTQQEHSQRQQQTSHQQSLQQSLNTWGTTTAKKDVDFRPKKEGQPDGKFELVFNQIRLLAMDNYPKSSQEAIALADQAYAYVNKHYLRTAVVPRARRQLQPTITSSSIPHGEGPTEGEDIKSFLNRTVGRRHGLHINGAN